MKSSRVDAVLAAVLFSLTIFFFIPVSIYLFNRESILAHDIHIVLLFLVLSGGVFAVVAGLLLFLKQRKRFLAIYFVTYFAAILWVQANLFNWDYGLLDGEAFAWNLYHWRSFVDVAVWMLFLGLMIVFGLIRKKSVRTLVWVLLFIQVCNLAYVYSVIRPQNLDVDRRAHVSENIDKNKFNFSKEKNIIVLLLDAYQSDLFLESIETDPDLTTALPGFTYYPNALGVYPGTKLSVPMLLTGSCYINQMPMNQFLDEAHRQYSLAKLLQDSGYVTGFYPYYSGAKGVYRHAIEIAAINSKIESTYTQGVGDIVNLTLFRVVPHVLKKRVFNNYLAQTSYNEDRDQFLYDMDKTAKADVVQPKLSWYHLKGMHMPWMFGGAELSRNRENAMMIAKCLNTLIIAFTDELKALGIYDKSSIIILGDHGHTGLLYTDNKAQEMVRTGILKTVCLNDFTSIRGFKNGFGWSWERALPLVLFKPFNATQDFDVSCVPISLTDIYPTILDLVQIEQYREQSGVSLLQGSAGNQRLRKFFFYYLDERKERPQSYFAPMYECEVTGFSWHGPSCSYTGNKYAFGRRERMPLDIYNLGTTLQFGMAGTGIQYLDDTWQSKENCHTTTGTAAALNIMVKEVSKDLLLRMEVNTSGDPIQSDGQHVNLYAAEKAVGSFEIKGKTTLEAVIPKDTLSNNLVTLRLELRKNPQGDSIESRDKLGGNKPYRAIRLYALSLNLKE